MCGPESIHSPSLKCVQGHTTKSHSFTITGELVKNSISSVQMLICSNNLQNFYLYKTNHCKRSHFGLLFLCVSKLHTVQQLSKHSLPSCSTNVFYWVGEKWSEKERFVNS